MKEEKKKSPLLLLAYTAGIDSKYTLGQIWVHIVKLRLCLGPVGPEFTSNFFEENPSLDFLSSLL